MKSVNYSRPAGKFSDARDGGQPKLAISASGDDDMTVGSLTEDAIFADRIYQPAASRSIARDLPDSSLQPQAGRQIELLCVILQIRAYFLIAEINPGRFLVAQVTKRSHHAAGIGPHRWPNPAVSPVTAPLAANPVRLFKNHRLKSLTFEISGRHEPRRPCTDDCDNSERARFHHSSNSTSEFVQQLLLS